VWLCVAVPLVSAGILLVAGRAADRWGHLLAVAASAVSLAVGTAVLVQLLGLPGGARVLDARVYHWIGAGGLSVDVGMRVDPLSVTFVMLVTFVGTLIHVYSVGYMAHDPARRRFFAYLNFFVASMLLLVLGDSYLVMFVGWEGVGLASYLLISFWNQVPANAAAGKKAFVMNRVGDVGLILAMMAMVAHFGSVDFDRVLPEASGASAAGAARPAAPPPPPAPTPLGSLVAALVPRDLEGALLLLSVMAVQVLVDPSEGWTRVLPLWSTRELASVVVESLGPDTGAYLHRGLAHGAGTALLLTAASWAVGALRLRTVSLPAPDGARPAYS